MGIFSFCAYLISFHMPILIPERTVQWAAFAFTFFVADYCDRVIVGTNRLNVPSYLVL